MENNTTNTLITAVTGLAIGILAGVLFAPAKGAETRAAIKGKANDLKDKATELKENVSSVDLPEILKDLKGKVTTKFENGKADVKEELLEKIKQLESAIENA